MGMANEEQFDELAGNVSNMKQKASGKAGQEPFRTVQ